MALGKTTLLSILSCLSQPTSGEIRLQGRVLNTGDQWVRRTIGVAPQDAGPLWRFDRS